MGSRAWASVVVAHGLSCTLACGIFPDQGQIQSPALVGRFLSTMPPGKSYLIGLEEMFIYSVTLGKLLNFSASH